MVGRPTTCSDWSYRYVRNAGTQFATAKVADVVKMIKYRRRVTASPKKLTKYMLCPITYRAPTPTVALRIPASWYTRQL